MKYLNFCFENIISLPSAVNVPLISSHVQIKPALAKWRFTFHGGLFLYITRIKPDSTLSSDEKFIS